MAPPPPAQAAPQAGAQSRTETIAAVVNEDAVSVSDVMDRLRLVMASSGMPDSQEMRERIKPQILSVLIEEKLKLQEAERMEIEVGEEEIVQGFASIAGQNNMSPEQFQMLLRKEGVSKSSLEDQIRSQIAWSRVIQMRLRPQVDQRIQDCTERLNDLQARALERSSIYTDLILLAIGITAIFEVLLFLSEYGRTMSADPNLAVYDRTSLVNVARWVGASSTDVVLFAGLLFSAGLIALYVYFRTNKSHT